MHPYLSYLIEDLREAMEAQRPATPDYRLLDPALGDAPDEMMGALSYLHGPEYALPELFGIAAEAFPPPDQLTEEEQAAVVGAIVALWRAYSIEPDTPAGAPASLIYPVFRDFWARGSVKYLPEGTLHLEFCDYEPQACPWGARFCTCKDQPANQ